VQHDCEVGNANPDHRDLLDREGIPCVRWPHWNWENRLKCVCVCVCVIEPSAHSSHIQWVSFWSWNSRGAQTQCPVLGKKNRFCLSSPRPSSESSDMLIRNMLPLEITVSPSHSTDSTHTWHRPTLCLGLLHSSQGSSFPLIYFSSVLTPYLS